MWHVGPPHPIGCSRISHLLHPLSPSLTLAQPPTTTRHHPQVLKYEHMEHYSAHHDFFNPREYASNPQVLLPPLLPPSHAPFG